MIIVKLFGGLGNQMFQYAFGRNFTLQKNDILKLDLSSFVRARSDTHRSYQLGHFCIHEDVASMREVRRFCFPIRVFKKDILLRKKGYIKEKEFHFNPSVFTITGDAYLDGYWQSEKYFKGIEKEIREEFNPKDSMSDAAERVLDSILSTNSVSIHVRRSDYITNKNASALHGTCSLDYYKNAVSMITEKISHPSFFVFSDDIVWARRNLILDYPTIFVSNPHIKDYEELVLMSLCKNNIIANSSFSWWGAWLNKNVEKVVIAPTQWFKKASYNTKDLTPVSWIKIK